MSTTTVQESPTYLYAIHKLGIQRRHHQHNQDAQRSPIQRHQHLGVSTLSTHLQKQTKQVCQMQQPKATDATVLLLDCIGSIRAYQPKLIGVL